MTAIPSLACPTATSLPSCGEYPPGLLTDAASWEQPVAPVTADDTLPKLLGRFANEGWVRGLHPSNANQSTLEADSLAVSSLCCPKCHRQGGLVYHPFRREDNTPGYRAAASCPDCFFAEEM